MVFGPIILNMTVCPSKRDVPIQRGFTLVELITIMLILGILAAVAVPRFFSENAFQARGAADQVRAALRYGQKVAIAQHRIVTVTLSNAPDSNSRCGAILAFGNVNCEISANVTIMTKTVRFNALGQPVNAVNVPLAANDTVAVGGTTITIEAETGYVR